MKTFFRKCLILLFVVILVSCSNNSQEELDLSKTAILISSTIKFPVHQTAVDILDEYQSWKDESN